MIRGDRQMENIKITDEPFAIGYLEEPSECLVKKVGAGLLRAARDTEITINPKTGFAELILWQKLIWAQTYHVGININSELLKKKEAEHPENKDDYEYLLHAMPDTNTRIMESFSSLESDILDSRAAWGGTWGGHAVPNLIDFARYGTIELRKKVNQYKGIHPENPDFYDGILLLLDAVDLLGERVHKQAEEMYRRSEGKAGQKLKRLMNAFGYCPRLPAKTFADACCVYVLLFSLDGIDSPGHFDQYMFDFWKNSEIEESREALSDIWEFFHDTRTWNLCISGSDENWNDLTNDLTYEIIEMMIEKRYQTPNVTMRCHRNTPRKLYEAAYRSIATGTGMPALYNDEAVCPALERLGIPPCDSHEYVMNGCNQIDIQGKSHMGLEDGEVNLAKAVELAISGGICTVTGKKIGADTGDAAGFSTFDDFFHAVIKQTYHLADAAVSMSNKSQKVIRDFSGHPLRSLTIEGCMEKARDYKNSGPLYGHGQVLAEGIADAIDSLAAVKRYVYEEKLFTMTELRDALNADFSGYETIFEILRNSPLRFGNDDDYVDGPGSELVDSLNRYLLTKHTFRGGIYGGGCSPFSRAAWYGERTGALPNGKRKCESMFSDSIGAYPGKDVKGPTALLNSCLRFDQTLPTSGFILNLKFDSALFGTKRGREGFIALCQTYFAEKGQQLQVNVLNREELLDAMEKPECHKNLIVRVGGYSDYFVNLPRTLQENVLARTSYAL